MNKKINSRRFTFCLMFFALATTASAHEKWFYETENYGLRWDLFFRPLPLVLFGTVIIATLAAGLWWRKRGKGFVPGPENLELWLSGLREGPLAILEQDARSKIITEK